MYLLSKYKCKNDFAYQGNGNDVVVQVINYSASGSRLERDVPRLKLLS